MTEQEKQLLERYLRYIRIKRLVVLLFILIVVITCILLYRMNFFNNIPVDEPIVKDYQEETINNNISDTNIEIIEEKEKINTTTEEKTSATIPDIEVETKQEETTPKQEVVEDVKTNNINTSNKKEVDKQIQNQKPTNKDFLFTDGYTMDNVTSAAQDYLKSSGFAGECIPLKDNEGVYIGMRVIFY